MIILRMVQPNGLIADTTDATTALSYLDMGSDAYLISGYKVGVISQGGQYLIQTSPGAGFITLAAYFAGTGTGTGTPADVAPAGGITSPDGKVYRLIIPTSPGRVDTGGTYPGCSLDNQPACRPYQFGSIQEAYDFAAANNEIPQLVGSADEAWDIVYGRKSAGGSSKTWMIAGIAALFFLPKLLKK